MQVRQRKKKAEELELARLQNTLRVLRARTREAHDVEAARAQGAYAAMQESSRRTLRLKTEALQGSGDDQCNAVHVGASQMLVIARLEHSGRLTALELTLFQRLERARVALQQELAALQLQEQRQLQRVHNYQPVTPPQPPPPSPFTSPLCTPTLTSSTTTTALIPPPALPVPSSLLSPLPTTLNEMLQSDSHPCQHPNRIDNTSSNSSVSSSIFGEQIRDETLDYLVLENPRLNLRLWRCRASYNVSSQGILRVLTCTDLDLISSSINVMCTTVRRGTAASSDDNNSTSATRHIKSSSTTSDNGNNSYRNNMSTRSSCPPLAPCVKGCVVIVEEEEEGNCPPGMSHSRILQSAGATAVVYTRPRIKGILHLPEVANTSSAVETNANSIQASDALLPPHHLKIPVVSRVCVCAHACVCTCMLARVYVVCAGERACACCIQQDIRTRDSILMTFSQMCILQQSHRCF